MKALILNMPLMLSSPIVSAEWHHAEKRIISRLAESGVHRRTCANAHRRLHRLADDLVAPGARQDIETDLEQHAWI